MFLMLVPANHGYGRGVFYYIGLTSHTLCLRWGRKREQQFVAWEFPDFMENGRGALVDQPDCCRPITPPTPPGDYACFGHGLGHDGERRFLHVPLSDPFGFDADALFLHFFLYTEVFLSAPSGKSFFQDSNVNPVSCRSLRTSSL